MKNVDSVPSSQETAFWDLFVLKQDGRWLGIRMPWRSLRRVLTLLTVLFACSALGLTGWLFSRWQVGRLDRALTAERLKSQSLENQLGDRSRTPETKGGVVSPPGDLSHVSVLPALGDEPLTTNLVSVEGSQVSYDPGSHDFHLSFELVRQPPREGSSRFYWILLLHSAQGLLSIPPALSSRSGELLMSHRGQLIDDVKIRRPVSARFKLKEFFENASGEPIYATLLVYDSKGSLLVRQRQEISYEELLPEKGKGHKR